MSRPHHPRRQYGTALLELALALPVLLTLVACVAFYGRLLYNYQVAQKASHDAVRYLSSASQASMFDPQLAMKEEALTRDIAEAELIALDRQAISGPFIFIQCDGIPCVGSSLPTTVTVEVQLTMNKKLLPDFIPFLSSLRLRARNTMRYAGT